MTRPRLGSGEVVATAALLADRRGVDEVVLSRVAEELGVQSSALYHHVDGVAGLRRAVTVLAASHLAATVRDAAIALSGRDALTAVAGAYRTFARDHPGQFASIVATKSSSAGTIADSHAAMVDVFARILGSFGLTRDEADRAGCVLHAAVYGAVALEAAGAIEPDGADSCFEHLLEVLVRGVGS